MIGIRSINKVIIGGCCLTFLAAVVNVSFMIQLGTSVSHLTGDLSKFSGDIPKFGIQSSQIWHMGIAIAGFLLGSILSGYFIHESELKLKIIPFPL
jgi:hypothetical protein